MKVNTVLLLSMLVLALQGNPFLHLEFFEYCRSLHYPVEDHVIPTNDHYNLRFYRLQGISETTQPNIHKLRKGKE